MDLEEALLIGLYSSRRTKKDDGIFIGQDKYVADTFKKFDFAIVKTASTLIETNKALLKDEEDEDVDVHLYRSMIGSLMYLTASRPDIMFVVCAYNTLCFQAIDDVNKSAMKILNMIKLDASLGGNPLTVGCQFLGQKVDFMACKKADYSCHSTQKQKKLLAANCCMTGVMDPKSMLDFWVNCQ
ncbi:hypothetical protein Tco_1333357 [Tanacetum coccineum]